MNAAQEAEALRMLVDKYARSVIYECADKTPINSFDDKAKMSRIERLLSTMLFDHLEIIREDK